MAQKHKVSISDVARAAGVSKATVSAVLNNKADTARISPTTQRRVREAVQHLGYQRHPFATALRTNRTGVIGAITRDFSGTFLSLLAHHLQKAAHVRQVELLVGHAQGNFGDAEGQLNVMHNQLFDGVILISKLPQHQAMVDNLRQAAKPFVSLGAGTSTPAPMVNTDEHMGVHLGLDYLWSLGHRRIAFVGDNVRVGLIERYKAFKAFTQERNLYNPTHVHLFGETFATDWKPVLELFRLPEAPTAIFCGNDGLAQGTIMRLHETGLRVPSDVSVLGYDGILDAKHTFPPLTTVAQAVEELSDATLNLLLELIADPTGPQVAARVLVPPRLITRASCQPLRP